MKDLKKIGKVLSKDELRKVTGGFACYCNGRYVGEMSSVSACWNAC
ncbi:bacteriocin [Pseudarcicella hirudinis]|nr:bacteriocin [Pseudarcicella hirudinis]